MAELDRAAISLRLGESREQAGLTQPEMAEALTRRRHGEDESLHWRTVQNYESPKKAVIPWDLLDQWARITGVTKTWLLHGTDGGELTPEMVERLEAAIAGLAEEARHLRELSAQQEQLVVRLEQLLPPADAAQS